MRVHEPIHALFIPQVYVRCELPEPDDRETHTLLSDLTSVRLTHLEKVDNCWWYVI